jgi:hypothetical protein
MGEIAEVKQFLCAARCGRDGAASAHIPLGSFQVLDPSK